MGVWSRRLTLSVVALVALTVAVPPGQTLPEGPARFPLAGLWELLTTRPAWAFGDAVTPRQSRGGPVEGPHSVSVDATRSKGGNGRKTPAMVDEWTLPARADVPQRTTGKALVGYDESTSTRIQSGTSDKVDLFQNADGSMTRRVYASPMNFRGVDGLWRPIDTTLRRGTDGRLRNTAGETAVVFAGARAASFGGGVTASESAGSGELSGADTASGLVSVTLPTGQSLEYGLVGAAPVEAEVAGSVATYADILPGTDVELVALGVGVKETLILKSAQVATQWVFPLTLNGLTARLQPDGSVALLDVSGKAVSMIPHGWMRDSRVDGAGEGATSNAVTYELISVGGKPALRMSADAAWVRDPARVFPIHLDPGVFPLADGSTYVQKNVTSPSSCCTNNNSGMPELKVGYHSSGPWRARSFLKFDSVSALAGYRVWSANLKVSVAWSGACPSTNVWSGMWAYDITSPWDPETVTNWSNQPGLGVAMASGGGYPDSTVCNNNPTNYNAGQWWLLPFGAAGAEVLNRWTTGGANHGMAILADESSNDSNSWKKLSSVYTSRAPYLEINYSENHVPQVEAMYPPHGYTSPTATPELIATASDPDNWPKPLTYRFLVADTTGSTVADSGPIASRSWIVSPAAALQWGKSYAWSAFVHDGVAWAPQQPAQAFSVQVAQPLITSSLSQNSSAHGFEPSIGNYTTQVTDANVDGVGPPLAIQRSYNSRDPRSGSAFGSGWSNLLDSKLTISGATATVTYPTGQDVAFGQKADGTWAPPLGGLTSALTAVTGGYSLTDRAGAKYAFTTAAGTDTWKLTSITDLFGRALTLGGFVAGRPGKITSTSGRSLSLTWAQPAGAAFWHIAQVATDPATPGDPMSANTWSYSYSGDRLTSVCPPTDATHCTTYSYGTNSLLPTAVLDAGPHTYLRLDDAASSPTAASSALDSIDTAVGVYANVTAGAGQLPGSTAAAAVFNGSTSAVELGKSLPATAAYQSVSLWFKTTGSGVLYGYDGVSLETSSSPAYSPVLYIGTDGKLRGQVFQGQAAPITPATPVNDGQWHHAVLTVAGSTQQLYLDGQSVGTLQGQANIQWTKHVYVGAGHWEGWPGASGTRGYFNGQIRDFAFYDKPLAAAQIATINQAGRVASAPLQQVTRPSGGVQAKVEYDAATGVVRKVTDSNGGVWQVGDASRSNAEQVYRAAVLARAPKDYFRFADLGPQTAVNEVNGGSATYNEVALGVDGSPFGATQDVASFNGTSSYVQLPGNDRPIGWPNSISLWFKANPGTSGVLYSQQTTPASQVAGSGWNPAIYVGTDGLLRAEFSTDNPTPTPITTANAVNDGQWHHVVLAASFNVQRLYVDGVKVGADLWGNVTDYGFTHAHVGAGQWQYWPATSGQRGFFNGAIAEFAFFKRELSAADAAGQFAARTVIDADHPAATGVPVKNVKVTDPAGNQIGNAYDLSAGGRQIEIVDARGKRTTFGYDVGGFLSTTTDPNGNMVRNDYDAKGNLIAKTTCQDTAAEICSTEFYTYHPTADNADPRYGKLIEVRDGRSDSASDNRYVITYTYDAQGNLTEVKDPLGRVKRHEFTGNGSVVADLVGLATSGRYVRINGTRRATTLGYSLWELEVYGADCLNLALAKPVTVSSAESASVPAANAADGLETTRWASVSGQDPQWVYVDLGAVKAIDRVRLNWESAYALDYQVQVSNDAISWTTVKSVSNQDGARVPAGLTSRVVSAGGAAQQISYAANADITRTVDAAGLATCFKRDGLGRINEQTVSSDTFPALVTKVGYDRLGRVTSMADPATLNRVTGAQHTRTTTNVYDYDGNIISAIFSDATGGDASRTIATTYNALGQQTSLSDAKNNKANFEYDLFGRQVIRTDPDATVTQVGYDQVGNLITTRVNGQLLESRAYDDASRLASVTDVMGWQTLYTYKDNNLLATVIRKDPATSAEFLQQSNVYDRAGNLTSQTSGATQTAATLDAAGRMTSKTTDPGGVARTTSYTYGLDNTVSSQTLSGPSGSQTVDAQYDPAGRMIWQGVRGTAISTSWTVDRAGNVTSQTDPNGNLTQFAYDEAGRRVQVQTPTVATEENDVVTSAPILSTVGYDTFGAVVEQRDGRGLVTRVERDANGNVVKQHAPAYTPPGSSTPIIPVTEASYDNMGRVDNVKDPLGNQTFYTYNQFGNVLTVKAPDNGITTFTYHPNGEQASVTDPTGAQRFATHDYLGRPATTTQVVRRPGQPSEALTESYVYSGPWLQKAVSPDAGRGSTVYQYNNVGEVTTATDPAGNATVFAYDFAGRNTLTTLPDLSKRKVIFDAAGRPTSQQELSAADSVLRTTSATYDANGNIMSATDARGTVNTFTYDALSQVTQVTQPVSAAESIITSYGYDTNGQPTRYTDGRGNKFRTTFNTWNLPESQIDPDGSTFTTTYDRNGRVDQSLSPGGVSLTHTYDVMSHVTRVSGAGAEVPPADRVYGYDSAGRVTSLSGPGGTNTLSYDDRSLLTSITGPSGDSSFTWTPDGLMASRTDAAGTTSYSYDNSGRLSTTANATAGLDLAYSYNNLSQLTQVTYGSNQNRRVFGYDNLHRLTTDELKTSGGTSIGKITYGWDANDNETSKVTTGFAGSASNTYTYDWANRLTSWNATTYAYDKSGNRTQAGGKTFSYNTANRLQSASDGTTYEYTARGTLKRTTVGTVSTDTQSDAFGQVTRQYSSATVYSDYTYDGLGRVIQPGFAYTGTGNQLAKDPTATYIRGPGGEVAGSKAGTNSTYAWTDLHTDLVGQFTASGTTLAGSSTYEPFGKVAASNGIQGSLGYQSEWTDAQTKRVNMHARWYNPDTGQFDSRDTVGVPNRFNYADNNPLTATDPSGHMENWRERDYRIGGNASGSDAWGGWQTARSFARDAAKREAAAAKERARVAALNAALPSCQKQGKKVRGRPVDSPDGCAGAVKTCVQPSGSRFARHEYQSDVKTLKNCTTIEMRPDGSCAINGFSLGKDDAACHDPFVVAKTIDNFAGRRGGYLPDGQRGDKEHLTALMINQAIVGAAAQKVNDERVACQADWGCRNAELIGNIVNALVTAVVFSVCTAATGGIGAPICALIAGGVGGYAGGVTVGTLQGQSLKEALISDRAIGGALLGAAVGFVAAPLGSLAGVALRPLATVGSRAFAPAMQSLSGLGSRIGGSSLGRLGGSVFGSRAGQCVTQWGSEVGLAVAMSHSFDPSTNVLTADGKAVEIKDIKVGDKVVATDPESGETTIEEVTALHENLDVDLVDVTVGQASGSSADVGTDAPTATLRTTGHHPFWDAATEQWVNAIELRPGRSTLTGPDGETQTVLAVHKVPGFQLMRDLTIDEVHTYYVLAGTTPVLVHNCGGLDWSKAKIQTNGVDAVEKHLLRFTDGGPLEAAEQGMLNRLRAISAGDMAPTPQDLKFYTHELRESVLYRKAGYPTGQPGTDSYELWDKLHTQALKDYGLTRAGAPNDLYHPSVR